MSGFKKYALTALLVVGSTPVWAVPATVFDFSGGPLIDHVSSAPTYNQGTVGVTIRGYTASGTQVLVAEGAVGVGVSSGGLDLGDINSSFFTNPGERLELSFNQQVSLNSISFANWDNFLLVDKATLKTGGTTLNLSTNNDNGLLIKTFNFASAPTGTVFSLQATGTTSSFRLAGLNVTAAVPEASSQAMMGLGLLGMGALLRRRRRG